MIIEKIKKLWWTTHTDNIMFPENCVRINNVMSCSSGQKIAVQVISKLNAIMFLQGNSYNSMPKKRAVLMAEYSENLHRKIDFISEWTPSTFNAEYKSFE